MILVQLHPLGKLCIMIMCGVVVVVVKWLWLEVLV